MLNQGVTNHQAHPNLEDPPVRYHQGIWMGFGSYQLTPGDSVIIVFVHAAKGPDIERCKEAGLQYYSGEITQEEKNTFLDSGKDSLFNAVENAQLNWDNYLSHGTVYP